MDACRGADGQASDLVVGFVDSGSGWEGGDEGVGEGGRGGGGEVEEVEFGTLEGEISFLEEGGGEVVDGCGEVGADVGISGW